MAVVMIMAIFLLLTGGMPTQFSTIEYMQWNSYTENIYYCIKSDTWLDSGDHFVKKDETYLLKKCKGIDK